MHRVIYCSRWAEGLAGDIDETLRQILARSIHNNRIADVTGLLVAFDGWFVQALEGPREHVGALLDRIMTDPRHRDVMVLDRCLAECRAFRDWNMAAVQPSPQLRVLAAPEGGAFTRTSAMKLLSAMADEERRRERQALGLNAA